MSAIVAYQVGCDEPSCERAHDRAAPSLREASVLAVEDGWAHRIWVRGPAWGVSPSLDFCPDHAHHAQSDIPPFRRKNRERR